MTDKRTIDLDPQSKHSPDRTATLTATLAKIMQALNHATLDTPAHGLGWPLSPGDPLHDLAVTAERGAQLYEQYGQALHEQHEAGDLFTLPGDERGPVEQVLTTVDAHLVKAVALSTALGEELRAAFNQAGALYLRDPNPDDEDEG